MSISIQAISAVASFVLYASIKTSLLIALVLLAHKLTGRFLSAQGRFLLWLPVVISLVMPLGFSVAVPTDLLSQMRPAAALVYVSTAAPFRRAEALELPVTLDTGTDGVLPQNSPPARSLAAPNPATSNPLYSWTTVLTGTWLAGLLLVLATIARAARRFARVVRRALPAAAGLQELLKDCRQQTRCSRTVRVLQSADVDVPMIAGIFKPVLLLPLGLEALVSRAQLRHIFMHELMHLQRGDIAGNWIIALVQALHWFNPVVWFAFFRLRQDRELACDAATLRHLAPQEHAAYGHTLLQLNDMLPGKATPALALGILESGTHLQERIHMLVLGSRHRSARFIVAASFLALLAAVAFSQPAPAPRGSLATDASADPVAARPTPALPATVPAASPAVAAGTLPAPIPANSNAQATVAETRPVQPTVPTLAAQIAAPTPEPAAPEAALQNLQAEVAVASFTPGPTALVLAAAGTGLAPPLPAEPYADLADIQTLAETLDAAQAESIRFIEKWDAIGNECAARADRFLGALSAACQKIRTAQRRGEIFRFGFECYRLGAIHEELFEHYRVTSMQQQLPAEVETALVANEHRLASFCSKDTYASHYPAFAAIFADAEALKYYPPRIQGAAGVNVAASRTRFREIWQQTGVTATSIDPMHISSWSPGPQPGSYPPAPVFVANGDGGVSPSPTPSAP